MKRAQKSLFTVIGVIVVLVFIGVWWLGHSFASKTAADFRPIDQAVTQLHLQDIGTVRLDKKTGGHQVLEGESATRTLVILVSQSSDATQQALDARLQALGLTRPNSAGSLCGVESPCQYTGNGAVSAGVVIYPSGAELKAVDQRHPDITLTVPAGQTGVQISIS